MAESAQTTTDYVLAELAKLTDRDLIIREVCLQQNIFWDEGERLVNRIEEDNQPQLDKKKSPLLLVLSLLFTAAGLVWALFSFYALVAPIYAMWKQHGGLVEGITWIYNFWMLFTFLLMATGMTISGAFGIRRAVKNMKGEAVEEIL